MLCWENVLTGDWQWDRPKELEQVKRNEASGSISRRHTEAKQDFPAADADNIVLECEPGCDDALIIGVRLHDDDFTDGTHAIDQALVLYKALSKTTCVKEEDRSRSMDEDDGVEASTLPPHEVEAVHNRCVCPRSAVYAEGCKSKVF